MNSVDFVKSICKDRRIPISRLERDLGFANGYIGQLKKGTFPYERLVMIADYLGYDPDYIATGGQSSGSGSSDGLSASEAELLAILKDLNEAGQQKVFDYAKDLQASGLYLKTAPSGVAETA